MKRKTGDNNKNSKKTVLAVIAVLALILAVLYVAAEFLLPSAYEKVAYSDDGEYELTGTGTKTFYLESEITDEMLSEYDTYIKHIYYETNGETTLITKENYYEVGGYAAVFFSEYIGAIKNGDHEKYASLFSSGYDSENGLDKFASGKYAFPPQRLYDIHITVLSEKFDDASGLTKGEYAVSYKIFCNTGDFRNDITDDTAPLIITTEAYGEAMQITDVQYRYG